MLFSKNSVVITFSILSYILITALILKHIDLQIILIRYFSWMFFKRIKLDWTKKMDNHYCIVNFKFTLVIYSYKYHWDVFYISIHKKKFTYFFLFTFWNFNPKKYPFISQVWGGKYSCFANKIYGRSI